MRTPDQVRTTSTPPTWRAKDVGGNRPPRTPMGPEPLFGSAGSGGCTKSRSRRHTHKDFTQLRAARMRKTLLLLVWIDSSSCSGAQEATVSLELDVGGCLLGVLPFLRRMGLLLYAQGVTHR